jgi:Ammonium Transporter Family
LRVFRRQTTIVESKGVRENRQRCRIVTREKRSRNGGHGTFPCWRGRPPDSGSVLTIMNEVDAAKQIGDPQTALNIVWTLLTGFLVMFMQAGFAPVETGLTRAKNVAHTMAMNQTELLILTGAFIGNRSAARDELDGLDASEMGGLGYAADSLTKTPPPRLVNARTMQTLQHIARVPK